MIHLYKLAFFIFSASCISAEDVLDSRGEEVYFALKYGHDTSGLPYYGIVSTSNGTHEEKYCMHFWPHITPLPFKSNIKQRPFANTLGWVPCSGPPPTEISGHIVALSSDIARHQNCCAEEAAAIVQDKYKGKGVVFVGSKIEMPRKKNKSRPLWVVLMSTATFATFADSGATQLGAYRVEPPPFQFPLGILVISLLCVVIGGWWSGATRLHLTMKARIRARRKLAAEEKSADSGSTKAEHVVKISSDAKDTASRSKVAVQANVQKHSQFCKAISVVCKPQEENTVKMSSDAEESTKQSKATYTMAQRCKLAAKAWISIRGINNNKAKELLEDECCCPEQSADSTNTAAEHKVEMPGDANRSNVAVIWMSQQPTFNFSLLFVLKFVTLFCISITITLYLTYDSVWGLAVAMFCLVSFHSLMEPYTALVRLCIPARNKTLTVVRGVVLALGACIFVAFIAVWAVKQQESYAWLMQDLLGFFGCILLIQIVRISSLKTILASTIALCITFIILFMMISVMGYISWEDEDQGAGQQAMNSSALIGSCQRSRPLRMGEGMLQSMAEGKEPPFIFKVPRDSTPGLLELEQVCLLPGEYSMVTITEVFLPGIFLGYLAYLDLTLAHPPQDYAPSVSSLFRLRAFPVYFTVGLLACIQGIFVTIFITMRWEFYPPTPLFNILACMVAWVVALGWKRGHLGKMWSGEKLK